jgi:magnesium transporter
MNNFGGHDSHVNVQEHNGVTWLDVQNPDSEVLAQLEQEYHLHPIHLQESTQKVQHNEVEREKDYLFLVLHYPVRHTKTDKIKFGQIGIFLGKHFLVTIRTTPSDAVATVFEQCEHDTEKDDGYLKHGTGYVLYLLVAQLLDEIGTMTDGVVSELDEIEDLVFDNNGSDAQRIGKVRQKIVRLMRVIGPKKIILRDLAEQIDSFTGHNLTRYYANNTKTVNRLWEEIEEAKETVEIYKDADFTTSTEQTNQILAILTLIFTFTIPITVVGTLYGMNVPVPGGIVAGAWTFLGRYTTFEILIALSILMAACMYFYFRNKKWF